MDEERIEEITRFDESQQIEESALTSSQQIEDKIEEIEEQILKEPPVEPKRRKKRTMTPEMLKKLEQARIKSVEVKKKNAEMNNKAKLLKKESDKLKIELLHKTEKELQVLKEKLNKPLDIPLDIPEIQHTKEELASSRRIEEPKTDKNLQDEPLELEQKEESQQETSSSDEEIVIKSKNKSKRKKKTKKIVIEDSETESESEILQLTQKQLKKLLIRRDSEDEFSKTFTKSYDKMNKLEKSNANFTEERNITLEDLYKRPNNYLNNESVSTLSGKKVINRRNGNTDAFEVARVKIQPTVIDMKPKSVMKRGIDYGIKDDDPAYKNLFGRGLYD